MRQNSGGGVRRHGGDGAPINATCNHNTDSCFFIIWTGAACKM